MSRFFGGWLPGQVGPVWPGHGGPTSWMEHRSAANAVRHRPKVLGGDVSPRKSGWQLCCSFLPPDRGFRVPPAGTRWCECMRLLLQPAVVERHFEDG